MRIVQGTCDDSYRPTDSLIAKLSAFSLHISSFKMPLTFAGLNLFFEATTNGILDITSSLGYNAMILGKMLLNS